MLFVCLLFAFVWFCLFPLPLGVCEGLRLVIGLLWTFLLPFERFSYEDGFLQNLFNKKYIEDIYSFAVNTINTVIE